MNAPKPIRPIGPLEVIEVPGNPNGLNVVVLHGFGADANDLLPLAGVIKAPPGTNWYFPNGPLRIPLGPHFYGRAWFPIDMEALERAIAEGKHRDLSESAPPELKNSRQKVQEFMATQKLDVAKTVFMGFSQGAMLSVDLALDAKVNAKGLVILSGALLNRSDWEPKAKAHAGIPFVQTHGDRDELLAPEGAKALNKILVEGGLRGKLHVFSGGHEIPPNAISWVNEWFATI